ALPLFAAPFRPRREAVPCRARLSAVIGRLRSWVSRADRAVHGLVVDLGLYGLSALFALVTATSSTLAPHRTWGGIAVFGYAAATLCVLVQLRARLCARRDRAALAALTWVAVAIVPLVAEAANGQAQEEVVVVERAGQRLLDTGTPYLDRAAIAPLSPAPPPLAP